MTGEKKLTKKTKSKQKITAPSLSGTTKSVEDPIQVPSKRKQKQNKSEDNNGAIQRPVKKLRTFVTRDKEEVGGARGGVDQVTPNPNEKSSSPSRPQRASKRTQPYNSSDEEESGQPQTKKLKQTTTPSSTSESVKLETDDTGNHTSLSLEEEIIEAPGSIEEISSDDLSKLFASPTPPKFISPPEPLFPGLDFDFPLSSEELVNSLLKETDACEDKSVSNPVTAVSIEANTEELDEFSIDDSTADSSLIADPPKTDKQDSKSNDISDPPSKTTDDNVTIDSPSQTGKEKTLADDAELSSSIIKKDKKKEPVQNSYVGEKQATRKSKTLHSNEDEHSTSAQNAPVQVRQIKRQKSVSKEIPLSRKLFTFPSYTKRSNISKSDHSSKSSPGTPTQSSSVKSRVQYFERLQSPKISPGKVTEEATHHDYEKIQAPMGEEIVIGADLEGWKTDFNGFQPSTLLPIISEKKATETDSEEQYTAYEEFLLTQELQLYLQSDRDSYLRDQENAMQYYKSMAEDVATTSPATSASGSSSKGELYITSSASSSDAGSSGSNYSITGYSQYRSSGACSSNIGSSSSSSSISNSSGFGSSSSSSTSSSSSGSGSSNSGSSQLSSFGTLSSNAGSSSLNSSGSQSPIADSSKSSSLRTRSLDIGSSQSDSIETRSSNNNSSSSSSSGASSSSPESTLPKVSSSSSKTSVHRDTESSSSIKSTPGNISSSKPAIPIESTPPLDTTYNEELPPLPAFKNLLLRKSTPDGKRSYVTQIFCILNNGESATIAGTNNEIINRNDAPVPESFVMQEIKSSSDATLSTTSSVFTSGTVEEQQISSDTTDSGTSDDDSSTKKKLHFGPSKKQKEIEKQNAMRLPLRPRARSDILNKKPGKSQKKLSSAAASTHSSTENTTASSSTSQNTLPSRNQIVDTNTGQSRSNRRNLSATTMSSSDIPRNLSTSTIQPAASGRPDDITLRTSSSSTAQLVTTTNSNINRSSSRSLSDPPAQLTVARRSSDFSGNPSDFTVQPDANSSSNNASSDPSISQHAAGQQRDKNKSKPFLIDDILNSMDR